jgi:hypothetical protein
MGEQAMTKQEAINSIQAGHERLRESIGTLMDEQMTTIHIVENWTVKDILAHLAAWSWEYKKEIKRVLSNKATWHKLYADEEGESEFNKKEVKKRQTRTLAAVIAEWETSFQSTVETIQSLSHDEWMHQSGNDTWKDGRPLTVSSLFDYAYQGADHEGGHARQIANYFQGKK